MQDGRCRFKAADVGTTCKGYVDIPSKNEDALQVAVATVGPISVAIDASHNSFQVSVCVRVRMCLSALSCVRCIRS